VKICTKPLYLLLLLLSAKSYSSITVSYSAGYVLSSSKEFNEYSVQGKGLNQTFQLGLRKEINEVGIYFDNSALKADIKHDGDSGIINLKGNAVGGYFTHYFDRSYLQLGYGKSTTKQSLESNFSAGQIKTIENIYGIEDGASVTSSHVKFRLGMRFLKFDSSIINGFYERIMDQNTSRVDDILGLDIKMSF